jgi:hypothetical protein
LIVWLWRFWLLLIGGWIVGMFVGVGVGGWDFWFVYFAEQFLLHFCIAFHCITFR